MRDIIEDIFIFMYTGDQLYETYLENGMKVLEVMKILLMNGGI